MGCTNLVGQEQQETLSNRSAIATRWLCQRQRTFRLALGTIGPTKQSRRQHCGWRTIRCRVLDQRANEASSHRRVGLHLVSTKCSIQLATCCLVCMGVKLHVSRTRLSGRARRRLPESFSIQRRRRMASYPALVSYEVDESERAANRDLVAAAQPSSMFSNNMQNRFGQPYVKRTMVDATPGPGWYGKEGERERGVASSSFFMSGTGRSGDNGRKAPGPAFYKPENPTKKSFLLNATRKWV